jgi:hypothetical protein
MITFGKLGRHGRLGNQMFQVASTIGIARRLGYEVGFPRWENHDAIERFGSTEDNVVGNWFPKWKLIPLVDPEPFYEYFIPWGFHGFDIPDGVSLVGHMQSELYFEHCRDEIKALFTMDDEPDWIPYTAIHVRMGDYGSDYHPICDLDYYRKAIDRIKGPYMVFSDEPERAWEMLKPLTSGSDVLFHGDTKYAFSRMKRCRAHIIANSTFSWWAAWLAGGEAVMPTRWFGPAAAQLETRDLRPPNWHAI